MNIKIFTEEKREKGVSQRDLTAKSPRRKEAQKKVTLCVTLASSASLR